MQPTVSKVSNRRFIQHFIMRNSPLKHSDMACVNEGSHSFACHPRLSTSGMNCTSAFTPQRQSINALWPVFIFRPAEHRRLSWPEWPVKTRWFTHPQTVTHPSTNWARHRVTSLIETNALPICHTANSVKVLKRTKSPDPN